MGHHLCFAFANAAPGREDDFNEWYDKHHLREYVENIPGFVWARRYVLNPLQREGMDVQGPPQWQYLAVYQLETDDVGAELRMGAEHGKAGRFTPHDGAIADDLAVWAYSPAGPSVWPEGRWRLESDHLLFAFVDPSEGRDEEFLRWYNAHHVPECVEFFPGLVGGQLYRGSDGQREGMSPKWEYLALYDLDYDDMAEYHRLDKEVREGPLLTPSNGALRSDYAVWVYTQIGAPVVA